jgi:hypothetical protein
MSSSRVRLITGEDDGSEATTAAQRRQRWPGGEDGSQARMVRAGHKPMRAVAGAAKTRSRAGGARTRA